jgi:hypothetical protein
MNQREYVWMLLHKVVNSDISDYNILANLSALLWQDGNFELSRSLILNSMILKEKGIPAKILDGNSELTREYLKYPSIGKQREI